MTPIDHQLAQLHSLADRHYRDDPYMRAVYLSTLLEQRCRELWNLKQPSTFAMQFDCAPDFVDGKPVRQRIEPRGAGVKTCSCRREQAEACMACERSALMETDELEQVIDAYLAEYEMTGDNGHYSPTEFERALIKDAVIGLLADEGWDTAWGRHIDQLARERASAAGVQDTATEPKPFKG